MTGPSPMRVWQGIESPEPPELVNDYAELLAMAQTMLAARQRAFPDQIASGDLDPVEAERLLVLFGELVGEWQWIVTGEGLPPHCTTIPARIEALDNSLRTIATIARQRGGISGPLYHQAQCVIALRWHAEDRRVLTLAARTRALRAVARPQLQENAHAA